MEIPRVESGENKNNSLIITLGIQSPSENGFMEPKYYAFRR